MKIEEARATIIDCLQLTVVVHKRNCEIYDSESTKHTSIAVKELTIALREITGLNDAYNAGFEIGKSQLGKPS